MRVLIQRVKKAQVSIDNKIHSKIDQGLLVFLGIHKDDQEGSIPYLVNKCINLRIFSDKNDKMNLSVKDINGEILIVSQFTLYGTCLKGKRPEFTQSAKGDKAFDLYQNFVDQLTTIYSKTQSGVFGADMQVELTNDGPVTLIIEK